MLIAQVSAALFMMCMKLPDCLKLGCVSNDLMADWPSLLTCSAEP